MTHQAVTQKIEEIRKQFSAGVINEQLLKDFNKMVTELNRLEGRTWIGKFWATDSSYNQVSYKSYDDAVSKLVELFNGMSGTKIEEREFFAPIITIYSDESVYKYEVVAREEETENGKRYVAYLSSRNRGMGWQGYRWEC